MPKNPREKNYLKGKGTRCPFCDSDELRGCGDIGYKDSAILEQHIKCQACGSEWNDQYKLIGLNVISVCTKERSNPCPNTKSMSVGLPTLTSK